MKTATLYKKIKDNKVQCLACSHKCQIIEGRTGICGVRQNIKGELKLLVYGKAAAVNVDPIEKKPLYHFLPGSKAFSIGTFGCNLRCANCQNFDLSQILGHKGDVSYYSKINWGRDLSPEEAVQTAKDMGCKSIAYTYNEPTIWIEYALDIMKIAKKEGLANIWVSNGFMTQATLDAVSPYLDAINIDIKSMSDKFYRENCGARVAPVLENCQYIKAKNIHLEITTLIIPTLSDNENMLKDLANFIKNDLGADVPWHISAFSGEISWKLKNIPSTTADQLKKAHEIGRGAGLQYVFVGNMPLDGLEDSYCPKCKARIIDRTGYNVNNKLIKGKCPECNNLILENK